MPNSPRSSKMHVMSLRSAGPQLPSGLSCFPKLPSGFPNTGCQKRPFQIQIAPQCIVLI